MRVLQIFLVIVLSPVIVLCAGIVLLAYEVGRFINDIYGDDFYSGGKE